MVLDFQLGMVLPVVNVGPIDASSAHSVDSLRSDSQHVRPQRVVSRNVVVGSASSGGCVYIFFRVDNVCVC